MKKKGRPRRRKVNLGHQTVVTPFAPELLHGKLDAATLMITRLHLKRTHCEDDYHEVLLHHFFGNETRRRNIFAYWRAAHRDVFHHLSAPELLRGIFRAVHGAMWFASLEIAPIAGTPVLVHPFGIAPRYAGLFIPIDERDAVANEAIGTMLSRVACLMTTHPTNNHLIASPVQPITRTCGRWLNWRAWVLASFAADTVHRLPERARALTLRRVLRDVHNIAGNECARLALALYVKHDGKIEETLAAVASAQGFPATRPTIL